jgi:3-oxoacyl-[acyl-carrier protein] reductase
MNSERVVLISGGSRGLGMALVSHFLEKGDIVATFSRSRTPFIDQTESSDLKSRFHFRAIDATDNANLHQFVHDLHEQYQRIDILINNAAVAYDGPIATFPDERFEKLIDINLTSVLLLSKWCVRFMLLRARGNIINISSIIGERGYAGLAAYSASKAGMLGITRSLARELGGKNINVNAIAPGYLDTEMSSTLSDAQKQQIIRRTPLGRLGTAKDVVAVAEFLTSEGARFITGQTITVDGGITC